MLEYEVCTINVATSLAVGDLVALIADVSGGVERDCVDLSWGCVVVDDHTITIAVRDLEPEVTVRPLVAELIADLRAFGLAVFVECDLLQVSDVRPAMTTTDKALTVGRMFEEELIGCVIGCGCARPGWDSAEAIAGFVGQSFAWHRPGIDARVTARAALRWLDYACGLAAIDVRHVTKLTERRHGSIDAFRAHLGPIAGRLRAALAADPGASRSR